MWFSPPFYQVTGYTPLMYAARENKPAFLDRLVELGCNPNDKNKVSDLVEVKEWMCRRINNKNSITSRHFSLRYFLLSKLRFSDSLLSLHCCYYIFSQSQLSTFVSLIVSSCTKLDHLVSSLPPFHVFTFFLYILIIPYPYLHDPS